MINRVYIAAFTRLASLRDDAGQGMVEYGLILALIAIVAILALTFVGHSVSNQLSSVGSSLGSTQP